MESWLSVLLPKYVVNKSLQLFTAIDLPLWNYVLDVKDCPGVPNRPSFNSKKLDRGKDHSEGKGMVARNWNVKRLFSFNGSSIVMNWENLTFFCWWLCQSLILSVVCVLSLFVNILCEHLDMYHTMYGFWNLSQIIHGPQWMKTLLNTWCLVPPKMMKQ